jgi:hypothetical protein
MAESCTRVLATTRTLQLKVSNAIAKSDVLKRKEKL